MGLMDWGGPHANAGWWLDADRWMATTQSTNMPPTDRRPGSETRANLGGFLACRKVLGVPRTAGPFLRCAAGSMVMTLQIHTRGEGINEPTLKQKSITTALPAGKAGWRGLTRTWTWVRSRPDVGVDIWIRKVSPTNTEHGQGRSAWVW